MRISFLLLAILITVQSSAQILDLEKEWFEIDGFFNKNSIQKRGIKSISIRSSNKYDGQKIKTKKDLLIFEFYPSGQLKRGLKVNEFINKLDTMSLSFYYDLENRLYKKIEHFKYYTFAYYYQYNKQGELVREIKIDVKDQASDTLYMRSYSYEQNDSLKIQFVRNENGKTFQTNRYLIKPNFKSIKISYTQNQSYLLDEFFYQEGRLKEWKVSAFYKDLNEMSFRYSFKQNEIDEQDLYKGNILTLKRAILYEPEGLIKNVVERNYAEQTIRIYFFDYNFY
ncbi:MAG: hypothetical protein HND54_07660 [Bacteroidetes bacterium]|nr:hypothetical protein [Bacteroidota bacterium]NOG57593.1 hypothetical protein [Bacteroidota bacterium]